MNDVSVRKHNPNVIYEQPKRGGSKTIKDEEIDVQHNISNASGKNIQKQQISAQNSSPQSQGPIKQNISGPVIDKRKDAKNILAHSRTEAQKDLYISKSEAEIATTTSSRLFSLKQIMDILNEVRTNPGIFADRIQQLYLDYINEKGMNMRTKIMTIEGKKPYLDAKKFLETQKPVNKCELDVGLTAAAYLHSVYCASINQQTHTGEDGGGPMERIKQFGKMTQGMCAENVLSRSVIAAEEWILDFIIDDGCPSRGHRKNIFNPQVSKIGLGVARQEEDSEWYFTMEFTSDGYKSEGSKVPADVMSQSGLSEYIKENK